MILYGYFYFVIYGAILVPLILVVLLRLERTRSVRVYAAASDDAPYEVRLRALRELRMRQPVLPRQLRWRDIGVGRLVSLLIIPVISVAGMWALPLYGDMLITFSSIPCLLFWLKLRKSNVLGAEVYALSTWVLAQSVWLGGSIALELLGVEPWDPSVTTEGFQPAIGILQFASVAYAIVGSAVAMRLVRRNPDSPFALIVLLGWIPLGVAVWSFIYFGAVHLALAVMLAGYAISRDVRRTLDNGSPEFGDSVEHSVFRVLSNHDRVGAIAFALLGVVVLSAFAVVGTWVLLRDAETPLLGDDGTPDSLWFLYAQVVPVAALALVAGVIAWKAGALFRYGAMLIGIGWPLLLSLALVPHRQFTESEPDLVGWIPVPFVMLLVLFVMWRVFGPGAVGSSTGEGAGLSETAIETTLDRRFADH